MTALNEKRRHTEGERAGRGGKDGCESGGNASFRGASLECTNHLGRTPLMTAAQHGHAECISVMLRWKRRCADNVRRIGLEDEARGPFSASIAQ